MKISTYIFITVGLIVLAWFTPRIGSDRVLECLDARVSNIEWQAKAGSPWNLLDGHECRITALEKKVKRLENAIKKLKKKSKK